jgi:hypothetical protein
MIVSASRRTDIPSCFSEWLINRIKQRFVLVRNPMHHHQVSKIDLSPDLVDCIVFWTKNPKPMMLYLSELKDYMYYFQFTLNAYATDIEPSVPSKKDEVIPAFQRLSDTIGPERVIWRYDPILISDKYSIEYHIQYFERIAKSLEGYTRKCTFSFIDFYRNTMNNIKGLQIKKMSLEEHIVIAKNLSEIADSYHLKLDTCAEAVDLGKYGIGHAKCIDNELIEKLIGYKLNTEKDKNQRLECGCVSSIDIGMYNTCQNGCKYCYANYSEKSARTNIQNHNALSPLLCGELSADDVVKERATESLKEHQITFFDQ